MSLAKHHLSHRQTHECLVRPGRARSPHAVKATLVIQNDKGLHTRPSTELVKCTTQFKSQIHLTYHGITVNAKSLLGILMLAAGKGSKIRVEASGSDAEEAVAALLELASIKFKICY